MPRGMTGTAAQRCLLFLGQPRPLEICDELRRQGRDKGSRQSGPCASPPVSDSLGNPFIASASQSLCPAMLHHTEVVNNPLLPWDKGKTAFDYLSPRRLTARSTNLLLSETSPVHVGPPDSRRAEESWRASPLKRRRS